MIPLVIRRESVRLELEDSGFAPGLARDAVAVKLLKDSINDLNGTSAKTAPSIDKTSKEVDKLGGSSKKSGNEVDKLSGRMAIFRDVALTAGPAVVRLGAAAVPALSATAMALGVTAAAAGVMVLALNGVGDGLKALNEYQLEPTAENFQKLQIELQKLGPAGADFVRYLDALGPEMSNLQTIAREGMLPGFEDGIDSLLTQLPGVQRLVEDISKTLGNLGRDAGSSLAGDDLEQFFDYLATDAAPTLDQLARSIGNFGVGFANILTGLAPATRDFNSGLLEMSQRFADWSQGLSSNDSFQSFLNYIRESGPQAIDLLGSMATTLADIAEAAAPVGEIVLPAITGLVKIIGALAGSPLGPFLYASVAGFAAYSRAATIATAAQTRFWAGAATGFKGAKVGLGIAAVALAVKGLADAYQKAEDFSDRLTQSIVDGTFNMKAAKQELADFKDDLDTDSPSEFLKNMFDPDVWADFTDNAFGAQSEADAMAEAIKHAAEQAAASPGAMALLSEGLGLTADEFMRASDAAEDFSGALSELNGWLDKRQALRDYRQSIRDVAEGMKDGFGKKDIENIDAVGRSIAKAADQLKSPARRADFLANSRASLADLAKKSGPEARAEIQLLISKLDELGLTHPKPKVDVDDKPARTKIAGVQKAGDKWAQFYGKGRLDADDGKAVGKLSDLKRKGNDWNSFYGVSKLDADTKRAMAAIRAVESAASRPVTKVVNVVARKVGKALDGLSFASGGYTGAGGRNEPAGIVHRGEVVIPQDRVRRDWPYLKSRYGDLPGFADGGLAGSTYTSRTRPGDSLGSAASEAVHGLKGLQSSLKGLQGALKKSETALDRQRAKVDAVRDKMSDLSNSVQAGLRSDIFADRDASANPWMAGATQGGPATYASTVKDLRGDISESKEFIRLVKSLRSRGLDGPALAELIGSGDIDRARLYASLSSKDLQSYERLYERREKLLAQAGGTSGQAAFGVELAGVTKDFREQLKETKGLRRDVRRVEAAIKAEHKEDRDHHTKTAKIPAANARRRAGT